MLALKANPETSLYLQLFTNLKDIKQKPERTKEEIEHWEEITKENPGYRDAYFQIAILSYQIYKDQEALKAVNKALELDPNFESAKKLSQLLLP
jgi:tetratricopeptide (TPR) repeat protein